MAANLAPRGKVQFLDANGEPLVGGKINTYAAGTTTPLATYTNYGALTPAANPVILDSRGEAEFWLGSAAYKFVVTDANDTPLWTIDNINQPDVSTLARLAQSDGWSLIGTSPSGMTTLATDLIGTGTGNTDMGFRGIPQNSQSANYTLVASDSGKHIYHPASDANARTYTIPANSSVPFPIGTAVTFINRTSQVVTIAINSDTLTLAGTTTTGSRSLAQNGVATAVKVTSTEWLISGNGLT